MSTVKSVKRSRIISCGECDILFHARLKYNSDDGDRMIESVVANKAATQSSTYNNLNASLAIDGSFDFSCCASCISTTAELMPWWRVDLD